MGDIIQLPRTSIHHHGQCLSQVSSSPNNSRSKAQRQNDMFPSLPGTPDSGSTENSCPSETLLGIGVIFLGGPHQTVNSSRASGLIFESKNFVEMENKKG